MVCGAVVDAKSTSVRCGEICKRSLIDVNDVKDYDVEVKSTADVIYGLWVEENLIFSENSEFRNNFNSAELLTKINLYQMKTFINLLIIQIILGRAVESLGMEIW